MIVHLHDPGKTGNWVASILGTSIAGNGDTEKAALQDLGGIIEDDLCRIDKELLIRDLRSLLFSAENPC
jgi:hypothetical protein